MLRRSLPRELAEQVDARVDAWGASGAVARIWARDPSVWTGNDEAEM